MNFRTALSMAIANSLEGKNKAAYFMTEPNLQINCRKHAWHVLALTMKSSLINENKSCPPARFCKNLFDSLAN